MDSNCLPVSDEAAAIPEKFHFIKPQTYMNRSGESILATASFYKIKLNEILVVHDEIELPFGTLSLKFSGGLGGHNGLRSMKASFGSADFWRLRIGIGRPDSRIPGRGGNPESAREAGIADWVLSDFTPTETEALVPILATGAELLTRILSSGPDRSLPEWAKKKVGGESI
jgi:PTH1 family peptidyl-tRNA hydrolase